MPSGCWAYNGDLDHYGFVCYRSFSGIRNEGMSAHRLSYEAFNGPIPEGHLVHHECENPGCINPGHLMTLTPGDHQRRHAEIRRAIRPSTPLPLMPSDLERLTNG